MITLAQATSKLRDFVLFFGEAHIPDIVNTKSFGGLCIPTGCSYIGLQSKGNFKVILNNRTFSSPQFYVNRQITVPYNMEFTTDNVTITFAVMKPTALFHLFGLQDNDFVNNAGNVKNLLSKGLQSETFHFPHLNSTEERLNWFDQFLRKQLKTKQAIRLNVIDKAVDIITDRKGSISIKELTETCQISDRYFQKLFKKMVGVTPSHYRNMVRFLNILSILNDVPAKDCQSLSSLFNYYDSAHFSKAFKQFVGINPSDFQLDEFPFLSELSFIKSSFWSGQFETDEIKK